MGGTGTQWEYFRLLIQTKINPTNPLRRPPNLRPKDLLVRGKNPVVGVWSGLRGGFTVIFPLRFH